MKGELCRTITADGLELHGFLASPETAVSTAGVIHVHGLAGNFYENRFIDAVGETVVDAGLSFLTVNTRGRDYLSDFICERPDGTKDYAQIGGIHEIFEDCLEDIEAWIRFLRSRGTHGVILQGHSHGALKVTYYLYKRSAPWIMGLILLSPSDDFGCQRLRLGEKFDEALEVARVMAAGGKAAGLMPDAYFDYPISASTYLDIFDEGSKLKMFNLSRTDAEEFSEIGGVEVPVLTIVGSVEEFFVGTPEGYLSLIEAEMRRSPGFTGHVISGAPHNYLDFEGEVARHVGQWLRSGMRG